MINWDKYKEKTHCEHCKTKLKYENTSPMSMGAGYCHTCHHDLVNKKIIKL